MEASLTFLYIVFFISISLYVVAGVIITAFVIPLQVKEAGVHNGLRVLRKQMLLKGFLALVVAVASIVALTARFFIGDTDTLRYIITGVILLHAVGTLWKSWIDYKIYHQQYSPQSKEFHKKVEALENRRKTK